MIRINLCPQIIIMIMMMIMIMIMIMIRINLSPQILSCITAANAGYLAFAGAAISVMSYSHLLIIVNDN